LQLTHAVDPALIYTHYLYVSGTSRTQHTYMEWFAKFAREYYADLPATVLDIGCNDGTQLHYFKQLGVSTHGIDPAKNLYPTSSQEHNVMCDFFNAESADKFLAQYGQMDLVVAQNSFAHNPDPAGYLRALRRVINPDGLFFIQTSQADMVLNNEFDTIYHEHVNFYNINSMRELCARTGFNLVDVQKTPIHGTSYIFVLGVNRACPNRIDNLIELERSSGLYEMSTYHAWTKTVGETISRLRTQCQIFAERGYKLIGYGAAAKGNTLLNAAKIQLNAIIDDNPLKQGLYSPGLHIPVVGIESLGAFVPGQPVLFIPLAWNFYKEIRTRILSHRNEEQDRFVRYFPVVHIE
jgi:SAM-dependent methyltransferase